MDIEVLGLGTAAMDVVLRCDGLPREDGFAFVNQETLTPGGSCANVLVALSRLGVRAGLTAKLGDDAYGRAFRDDLESSGVSTRHLRTKPGGVTLHTFVTVAGNGAKAIFAHLGDSLLDLREDEAGPEMVPGLKAFYTDMFPGRPALKLARLCREQGVPVVFNLQASAGFMELCGVGRDQIDEMISLCDVFLTSGHALTDLTGVPLVAEAAKKIAAGAERPIRVAATLGNRGCLCADGDGILASPALPVAAVDTTGAGDAFAAGLIFAMFIQSRPLEEALRFANASAAVKCTIPGPRTTAGEAEILAMLTE